MTEESKKYGPRQIARELIATARGDAYHGNALYVAMDFPGLSDEQRRVISRYLHGTQCGTDHVALDRIAVQIAAAGDEPRAAKPAGVSAMPDLLAELVAAHRIIGNALNLMTPEQKLKWGELNARDGVDGEGITRANERDAAITKATSASR